jgi:hypothetical protein
LALLLFHLVQAPPLQVPIQNAGRQFVIATKIAWRHSAGFKLVYQLLDFLPTSLPSLRNFMILVHNSTPTKNPANL